MASSRMPEEFFETIAHHLPPEEPVRGEGCETAARRVFWRSCRPGRPGHAIESPGQDP
jgi:hypothetical protein